jgi:hypothetical protein
VIVNPPVTHQTFLFTHVVDPTSFTTAQVTLTGPGGSIPVTSVMPVSGTNNQIDVTFPALTQAGNYTLVVSTAVHDPFGNPLPAPYTAQITIPALVVGSTTAQGLLGTGLDHLDVFFERPIDPTSFGTAQATLTGPGGITIPLTGVAPVAGTGNAELEITFAPLTVAGSYQLSLSTAIHDPYGNPLTAFSSSFTVQSLFYSASMTTFQNIELSGQTGTQALTFTNGTQYADNDYGEIDFGTGNTFTFYGQSYDRLFVSSNGLITFGSGNADAFNTDLRPGSGLAQPAIAALWAHWIKYQGDPGGPMILWTIQNNQLIIEWNRIYPIAGYMGTATFEAILNLNTGSQSGDIVLNYSNLQTGDNAAEGRLATVGVHRDDSSLPVLVSYFGSSDLVGTGKAVRIHAS